MTTSMPTLLFIGSQFFGYERDIIVRLKKLGWKTDFFSDCPPNKFLFKVLKKTALPIARRWCDAHFVKLFNSLDSRNYSKVFILKGEGITRRMALRLKKQFQNTPISLYMWDSVKNLPFGVEKLDVFDRVLSFDPIDVARYPQVELYPLFFVETFAQASAQRTQPPDIDLFFIGTLRPDRYELVDRLRRNLPEDVKCEFRFYVQKRLMYDVSRAARNSYRGSDPQEFIFEPLRKDDIATLMARSRVIIDVEHAKQTGLTMRTFETLGMRRKLATTNPHVVDYSFYHPQNIHVIDRSNPTIPIDFVRSPMAQIDSKIIETYSLSTWLDNVVLH